MGWIYKVTLIIHKGCQSYRGQGTIVPFPLLYIPVGRNLMCCYSVGSRMCFSVIKQLLNNKKTLLRTFHVTFFKLFYSHSAEIILNTEKNKKNKHVGCGGIFLWNTISPRVFLHYIYELPLWTSSCPPAWHLQPVTLSLHHLIWSVHLMFISNLVHPAHSKFKSQHLHLCQFQSYLKLLSHKNSSLHL